MHKVRRKIFLIKQKKKRRKKLQKIALLAALQDSGHAARGARRFRRESHFVGCSEALEEMFEAKEMDLYRIVHDPIQLNDALVQNEQEFPSLTQSMLRLSDTIAPNSSIDDQYEHVRGWSLSFNVDECGMADAYWDNYKKRKTEVQKRNYFIRKGTVMAKYHITPFAGVVQKEIDDDGHTVMVEFDDFVLEDYRDREFGLKPLLDYKTDEEKK